MSRRARVAPTDVGLTAHDDSRRVAGLRREEVAALAGMSLDYYKRLERGNLRGASEAVLEALADALQLDDAERAYLADLARAANQTLRSRSRASTTPQLGGELALFLDQMSIPAIVRNYAGTVLGANALGRALMPHLFDAGAAPANIARTMFLDARSRAFWRDWEGVARSVVAILRGERGHRPDDPSLLRLVDELSARSADFRRIWRYVDVEHHHTGSKRIRHPDVGDLDVRFQSMTVETDTGVLTVAAFVPAPDATSEAAYQRLRDAVSPLVGSADVGEQPAVRGGLR